MNRLKKGSAVLIDGELQSHSFKTDDGHNRNVVEIKAQRIQFLNKKVSTAEAPVASEEPSTVEDDSFDKLLTNEELQLLNNRTEH